MVGFRDVQQFDELLGTGHFKTLPTHTHHKPNGNEKAKGKALVCCHGCFLANLLCGAAPLDVVFGSIATLIGAVGSYYLGKKNKWLVCLPPILSNTIIVPWVLRYAYGSTDLIPYAMLTVGIGEILAIGILGQILLSVLIRYQHVIFGKAAA